MPVNKHLIDTLKDNLISVEYDLYRFESAAALAKDLKVTYKKMGIDYTLSNSALKESEYIQERHNDTIANPPQEIYEYQNFFLIEKQTGEYILLDGFRRLLYYIPPATPITVRVYKQKDLTNVNILSLLLFLNHFKLIGNSGGSYFDRGFALLLNSVFGLNIHPYYKAFDAYLSEDEKSASYSVRHKENKIENLKTRIVNPNFVEDVKFIQSLYEDGGYMVNFYLGTMIHNIRTESNKPLDLEGFKRLHSESKVLPDLIAKYKVSFPNINISKFDSREQKLINQIIEQYNNIFTQLDGGAVEETYAEELAFCKSIAKTLKADKTLMKITGVKNHYVLEPLLIQQAIKDIDSLKFKCVIYPEQHDKYDDWHNKVYLKSGLYENIKITLVKVKHMFDTGSSYQLNLSIDGEDIKLSHQKSYSGWNSTMGKYFGLASGKNTYNHKIELYAETKLTQDDIKAADKNRSLLNYTVK